MNENIFQSFLIKEIRNRFQGALVLKTDPTHIQGMPDLLVLFRDHWAGLEVKKKLGAHRQPNQEFYVNRMNEMSFARFIYPENYKKVLDEMAEFFKSKTPLGELIK